MSDSTILREYLVALGFKVNEPDAQKFDKRLVQWDRRATMLARGLGGVAVAAQAMVTQFAYSMERLYYSSRRAESAAGNIKALEFGASQIGVDNIRGSLEALARNLRSNPGLTGLLESLGVQVRGRDKAEVLTDLVGQLRRMPFYVAERYANLFGIDPDTLLLLQEGLEEMQKAAELRKQIARDLGVDTEAAAVAGKAYAQSWREMLEYAGLFKDALALTILPQFQEMANVMKLVLSDWTKIVQMDSRDFWDKMREGLGLKEVGGGVKLSQHTKEGLQLADQDKPLERASTFPTIGPDGKVVDPPAPPGMQPKHEASPSGWFRRRFPGLFKESRAAAQKPQPLGTESAQDAQTPQGVTPVSAPKPAPAQWLIDRFPGAFPKGTPSPPVTERQPVQMPQAIPPREQQPAESSSELFRKLEKQYALPPGLLDRIWKKESNRGDPRFMRSSAGAKGHFQFMDPTAKEYGVKDPDDLQDSAKGAARYMSDLLRKYGGDLRAATAAYNWGMGNVDRYGLGSAPKETRDYMDAVAGPQPAPAWNQTNHISITGTSGDANSVARSVQGAMSEVNADAIRNFTPKVQ